MFRPLNDWVLVKLDPLPEKLGSIFVPASAEERVRTGTVVRVGPGRYVPGTDVREPTGLEPEDKIAFFRENFEHQQGQQIVSTLQDLGDDLGLLRAHDVLYAWGPP